MHVSTKILFLKERKMKRILILLTIVAGLIGLSTLGCKPSKEEAETFYLRSCKTGRLIGPIRLTSGHSLPSLDEQNYIVAEPTDSELQIRKILLETIGGESHYSDCVVDDVIKMVRHQLKRRLDDKAPPIRLDDVEALVTMDISREDSAYDALCNVAALAKVHLFIEDGAAILSSKPLKEMAVRKTDTKEG
jgi:hypothetical protein